jgi:ribonuclease Z
MSDRSIVVTLLGTGTPRPTPRRSSASTLVEVGGHRLLFDCGRGAVVRLSQVGAPLGEVGPVFLTHLHSDHVVGLADLWITGWHLPPTWRREAFRVRGPAGTASMMAHLEAAFAVDRAIRIADEGLSTDGIELDAQDVDAGVVFDEDGVQVTAIRVDHWPGDDVPPSLGYRVDFEGRSVVLSGDTRYCERLEEAATGADLLIHEVAAGSPASYGAQGATIQAHHTLPSEAAQLFSNAAPRLAVYSHIILFGGATEADLESETRAGYDGRFLVGEDLMRIEVGDEVTVSSAAGG